MLRKGAPPSLQKAVAAQYRRICLASGATSGLSTAVAATGSVYLAQTCRYMSSQAASTTAGNAAASADAIFSNNPLELSPSRHILDLEQLFTASELEELTEELALLQQAHGVQCVVATVPSAGAMPPKTLATHVFNTWGIGSPLFNDGLLIVLSTRERWW